MESTCPVFSTADMLGKKWTIPLLEEIALHGELGYNFILKRMFKISPKVLAQRLSQLEKSGIITKKSEGDNPKKTIYALTEKGRDFQLILIMIKEFEIKHKDLPCWRVDCVNCPLY